VLKSRVSFMGGGILLRFLDGANVRAYPGLIESGRFSKVSRSANLAA
jgi:hypothetical protein